MRFSSIIDCLEDRTMLNAFELVETEDMISFSAGFPSPESYPLDAIKDSFDKVIEKEGREAMSYCSTSGFRRLREIIVERMERKFGVRYDVSECIITSGSQQGLDMSGRLFVNKGDVVLFESPSYLGAVNALRAYEAELVSVPTDENGIIISELEKAFNKYGDRIRMIYVIPDFQNPSGETLGLEERMMLVELARKHGFLIVEDSPYRELRYEGEPVASMYSLYPERVIHLGSFSKIFAPGFRLGWILANPEILDKIYVCKQSLDLCPPVFDQYVAAEFLDSGKLDKNLTKTIALYKSKRDLLLSLLEKYMPEGISWTHPEGGLFLFLTMPEGFDSVKFYDKALSAGVAYVAGSFFHPDGSGLNTMRMNFSFMSPEKITAGVKLLAELLRSEL